MKGSPPGFPEKRAKTPGSEGVSPVVAWDTSTGRGTLVVGYGNDPRAEKYFHVEKGHLGWLLPTMDSTLKKLDITPSDIGFLAVGIGPGNFTGLKVGVSTAKSISLALGIPLLGVPTLDILAEGASGESEYVVSLVDARRGEYYMAAYRRVGEYPRRVSEYMCLRPGDITREIASLKPLRLELVGSANERLLGLIQQEGIDLTLLDDPFPRGRELLSLSQRMRKKGLCGETVSVNPLYLRSPVGGVKES